MFEIWSPRPQKVSDPPLLGSKLQNCRTEIIVCSFESSWRDKQILNVNRNALFPILLKVFTVSRTASTVILFLVVFAKILVIEYCEYHRSVSLIKSFRMSMRWSLYDNFDFRLLYRGRWPFGGRGTRTQRRTVIVVQRVSSMTGHLIFACHLARPKSVLGGHPNPQC